MIPCHRSAAIVVGAALCAVVLQSGCAASNPCSVGSGAPPAWLTETPVDSGDTLYRVGHADASDRADAIAAAQRDATRQLIEQFYGQTVHRRFERIRDQVQTQVTEKLATESGGRVTGTKTAESFWQRCPVEGALGVRASVLVTVQRGPFAQAVRDFIEASPAVVEASGLERDGTDISTQLTALAEPAVTPAKALEAAAAWHSGQALRRRLDSMVSRYQQLLGRELVAARAGVTAYRRLADAVMALRPQLRIGVKSSDRRLVGLLTARLAQWGIGAHSGGCGADAHFLLKAVAGKPDCAEGGMHTVCSLPIRLELQPCSARASITTEALTGKQTRGAGMGPKQAVQKAWANLAGPKSPFARGVYAALERLLPLAPPQWQP
ncbi:MAG: hypothetical protein ACI9WU_005043 [Myxococcota bacterium]|jgi:hypothetical protein